MRINDLNSCFDNIAPTPEQKQRMLDTILEQDAGIRSTETMKHRTKRLAKRRAIPAFAATAAVLTLMLLVYSLFPAQTVNSFTLRAYAIGQQEDGTTARLELDISTENQLGAWSGFFDGEFLYLNIYFDVSGENIASADFSIENGFFARQYIEYSDGWHDVVDVHYNVIATINNNILGSFIDEYGNIIPFLYRTEIVTLGSRITLEDIQAEDYLLFMAVPYRLSSSVMEFSPHGTTPLEFQVDVVFNNGERQSEAFALGIGDGGGAISHHPDLGDTGCFLLALIDLDDATLIPESVHVLPPYDDVDGRWGEEMFVWEREDWDIFASRRLYRAPGDEQRFSFSMVDGKAVMPLIRLDENGNFIAMEYILPSEIARNFWQYRAGS